MAINTSLVDVISDDVRILKDTVEYHWYVGCSVTATANVIGYWDRNGYDNLIHGDSSTYSDDVKLAMASEGHLQDYYNPDGYDVFIRDASETGPVHDDDSIADFLHSSRSSMGLYDGFTYNKYVGLGTHGYAAHRGYDDFIANYKGWGDFNFTDISQEIDAGRPVILSVDSSANGRSDHSIVVYGYDNSTSQLLIHDGWSSTDEMRWIDFSPMQEGRAFGILDATFITPPETLEPLNETQFMHLQYNGSYKLSSWRSTLDEAGEFSSYQQAVDSNLYFGRTLGIASADGHTVYGLYNNDTGTAELIEYLAYGDGTFNVKSLSKNSGLDMNTIGFATADNKTFYQLVEDQNGTASLYEAILNHDGTFATKLMSYDSGLGFNTIGFSTTDGQTFYQLVDDGVGSAALYEAFLLDNGSFSLTLLNADSNFSRDTHGQIAWEPRYIEPEVYLNPGEVQDQAEVVQYLTGTGENDVFIVAGNSADYGWGPTTDGEGIVIWKGGQFDILVGFEAIRFDDMELPLAASGNTYQDIADVTQYISGTPADETFVINGNSADYNWGPTEDGQGIVIWNSTGFDILTNIEHLQFNDKSVDLGADSQALMVEDIQNQTQYLAGTDATDDTFVIHGNAAEYQWGATEDGTGIVVWGSTGFDILNDFEIIQFDDQGVAIDALV